MTKQIFAYLDTGVAITVSDDFDEESKAAADMIRARFIEVLQSEETDIDFLIEVEEEIE